MGSSTFCQLMVSSYTLRMVELLIEVMSILKEIDEALVILQKYLYHNYES